MRSGLPKRRSLSLPTSGCMRKGNEESVCVRRRSYQRPLIQQRLRVERSDSVTPRKSVHFLKGTDVRTAQVGSRHLWRAERERERERRGLCGACWVRVLSTVPHRGKLDPLGASQLPHNECSLLAERRKGGGWRGVFVAWLPLTERHGSLPATLIPGGMCAVVCRFVFAVVSD